MPSRTVPEILRDPDSYLDCDECMCAECQEALREAERYEATHSTDYQEVAIPAATIEDMTVAVRRPGYDGYAVAIRTAFAFFRRHAEGRYSDRTLMGLTRDADRAAADTGSDLPLLVVAERPFSYDEDTEVKTGGTVGMYVLYPDGRTLVATHRDYRRRGVSTAMNRQAQRYMPDTQYFWVGAGNKAAQHALLEWGLVPTAVNNNGAVRYGWPGGEEDT